MPVVSIAAAMAALVTLAFLVALAPRVIPATDRSPDVAATPTAAAPEIVRVPHVDRSGDDIVDEPALSDEDVAELALSGDPVSDVDALDPAADLRLLGAEATTQRQLADLGWTVTVDGTIGAQTRRAIAEFQHANGLAPTGDLDAETSIRLGSPGANGHQRYLADPLPAPASPAPSPAARVAPRQAADPMTRIEQFADSVGFDWRSRGVTFVIGCHPDHERCSTGSYFTGTRQIFITARILADTELLRSVVLHELAHAGQFPGRGWPEAADDVSAWGRTGIDGLEAAADCLAAAWGASRTYYWSCPADAEAHMLLVYRSS
jgi:hypothetical protein